MALENVSELSRVLASASAWDSCSPATPTGCARGWTSSPPACPRSPTREAKALLAQLVADNARHMMLFRERAIAHGVDPDAYDPPREGEVIYERIDDLAGLDELAGYALGSLDHFSQLLAVYRDAADGEDRATIDDVTADVQRHAGRAAAARRRRRRAPGRRGARALPRPRAGRDAALRACRLRPRCRASPTCSASCRRSRRAPGASPPCARARAPARCSATACASATATASTRGPSWPTSTPTGPRGARSSGARSTAGCWAGARAWPSATSARWPSAPCSTRCAPSAARRPSSPTSQPGRRRTCSRP